MISFTFRRFLQLALATLGMVALLTSLVAATYVYDYRFDLSPGDRYTLSDHALQVLGTIDEPIKITAFIRTEDARNPLIKDLLWQASRENPLITYDVIDVNRNPALAAQYSVSAYGAVVVEGKDARADFGNPSEGQLMSALLKVSAPARKVYFLTGHGECSTKNTDRKIGCSLIRDALQMEAHRVDLLSLAAGNPVPDDADVVIIMGPKTDLLEGEIDSVRNYLEAGGKLLVMIDPFRARRLVSLLGLYGVQVGANIIIDPDNRIAGGEPFSAVMTDINRGHLISRTLDSPPLFSLTASVSARDDEELGRHTTQLLKSGLRSWASYDPLILEGAPARFVAGRDLNGPLSVAVDVSQPAQGAAAPDGARTGLVVIGDSDFANNRFLDYLGNKDLVVNTVNWLAREDRLMGTRPQNKAAGTNQLFISQEDGRSVFWSAVVLEPGLFFLLAVGAFVWRRFAP